MNKTELWSAVVGRYPEFGDPEHVLSQRSRGLKRLLEQAWDEGFKAGLGSVPKPESNPMDDILKAFTKRS